MRTLGVDSKTLHSAWQYRQFSETAFLKRKKSGLGAFWVLLLEGKKSHYGVCNVAKLATPCISISPTMGWATGQTENTHCVNHTLIKLVPLK